MDSKSVVGGLVVALTVGGISSVAGCFSESEVATAVGERAVGSSAPALPASSRSPAATSQPTEDPDPDPFGLLTSGLGFNAYSTDCELTDDPFADCL